MTESAALLRLQDLRKTFEPAGSLFRSRQRRRVTALDGVTLEVLAGRSVGIVGESGCGKTTLARIALLLERPSTGSVLFRGEDVTRSRGASLRGFRAAVQAVFQDPWSSLNPRLTVKDAVTEPLITNARIERRSVGAKAEELLTLVGLDPKFVKRYPHELSGGQRQRVAIARAISLDPALIILDEPVSSLDVSIRAQIMNLLRDLQVQRSVTYVTIGHHLASVGYISQEIVVMYLGKIVEVLAARDLSAARHPYTRALLAASLASHPRDRGRPIPVLGDIPSPYEIPSGCRFRSRCPAAMAVCAQVEPPLQKIGDEYVACHLYPADVATPATTPPA
jgi:peptide/nickel transport system ATP-binding protein/oligopeptide transport system ATP-binding protein